MQCGAGRGGINRACKEGRPKYLQRLCRERRRVAFSTVGARRDTATILYTTNINSSSFVFFLTDATYVSAQDSDSDTVVLLYREDRHQQEDRVSCWKSSYINTSQTQSVPSRGYWALFLVRSVLLVDNFNTPRPTYEEALQTLAHDHSHAHFFPAGNKNAPPHRRLGSGVLPCRWLSTGVLSDVLRIGRRRGYLSRFLGFSN